MEKLYILTPNSGELEDIRIIITEEEAITLSKQYPSCTVEIFEKDWENSKPMDLSDEGIQADLEKSAAKKLAESHGESGSPKS